MPNHGNVNTMPKTTSKITKAPAPTKPKTGKITKKKAAGKITKKEAEITDFDANLFEPIPITAIEHIATKVRFAKDDNVRIFNTSTSIPFWASTSILNPPTTNFTDVSFCVWVKLDNLKSSKVGNFKRSKG